MKSKSGEVEMKGLGDPGLVPGARAVHCICFSYLNISLSRKASI